jgi:hypothetical protein
MSVKEITSNSELITRVRAATGYDESDLSTTDMESIVSTTKLRLSTETDATDWYADSGLGLALYAYTCMRVKAAVENIPLQSYSLGDESVAFDTSDESDSMQMQQWVEDVNVGLQSSDAVDQTTRLPSNSADYIGSSSVRGV